MNQKIPYLLFFLLFRVLKWLFCLDLKHKCFQNQKEKKMEKFNFLTKMLNFSPRVGNEVKSFIISIIYLLITLIDCRFPLMFFNY